MIVNAKFIGKDSLGYKGSWTYDLQLDNQNGFSICRLDGSGLCKYDSLSAFLKNWDCIVHKKPKTFLLKSNH
jgi:hypothetical protein